MTKETIKGKWWNIDKKIDQKLIAKYDRIKDFKMDPSGYFLIKINKKNQLINVGYCKINKNKHVLLAEVTGNSALEIINTLITNNFISSLQHSGDMGIELCKAEIALKLKIDYTQDKNLSFDVFNLF